LKAAFGSRFQEGVHQEYRFQEEFDENITRLLVEWFYTKNLDIDENFRQPDDLTPGQEHKFLVTCLIKLWILADQLLIPSLKTATKDQLMCMRGSNCVSVPVDILHWMYQNTCKNSPVREWIIGPDRMDVDFTPEMIAANAQKFPQETLVDMVISVMKDRSCLLERLEKWMSK
jgi:hypothetical protein